MKALVGAALILSGCASVNFAQRRPSDRTCAFQDKRVEVLVHSDAAISCDEAQAAVAKGLAENDVTGEWTVIFTGGYAGFDVNPGLNAYAPKGVTYPASRTIVVTAGSSYAVSHELGHAADFDHGLKNTRDGR